MTGRLPTPAELQDKKKMKKNEKDLDCRKAVEKSFHVVDKLSCPSYLSPLAKKEWKRVMKLYKQMDARILNDLDVTALAMYAEAVAMYQTAQKQWVQVQTLVSSNKASQKLLDKIRTIMNDQVKVVTTLSEQLCLTPVGRARMGVAVAKFGLKEEKSLDDFFAKFGEDDNEDENQGDEEVTSEDEEVANDEASVVNVNVESTVNDFIERVTEEEQEEQEESEDLLK